eukprot:2758389-Amphidinium_carterae.1
MVARRSDRDRRDERYFSRPRGNNTTTTTGTQRTQAQGWWPEEATENVGTSGTSAVPGATTQQQPQALNALKLNTLLVDKPSLDLSSFSSSTLRLKVDSEAGASVIPIGSSQEPIQ